MRRGPSRIAVAVAGMLLAAACGADGAEEPTTTATSPSPPVSAAPSTSTQDPATTQDPGTSAPAGDLEPGAVDPGLDPLVRQAVSDLAAHLDVDGADIEVLSGELVTWSDASLGCPKPGMVYAQVLVDGALIRLAHDGTEYRYHTGGDTFVPFRCDQSAAAKE